MKLAICILVHHKQWLIQSSLISLLLQNTNVNYDLHFIIIKGNGECKNKKSYKDYFKYSKIFNKKNVQLSNFDKRTLSIINKINKKKVFHYVENDHGLDSGAWIKFIKSKYYLKYDYCFFLMEGFIFTNENVIDSIVKFIKKKKPNFLTSGHEKRIILKKMFFDTFYQNIKKIQSMEDFEKKNIYKIIKQFAQGKKFKRIINNWPNYLPNSKNKKIKGRTENHVIGYKISFFTKIKLFIKSIIYKKKIINLKKNKFIATEDLSYYLNIDHISNETFKHNNIMFHNEKSPYYYGCSCQHLMSKKYLSDLHKYLNKNRINYLMNLPYFATPFEILWGIFPKILGYKKWFFNGIHRPRKHFLNLNRDDDINGVKEYLNLYYGNLAFFRSKKNKIILELKGNINSKELINLKKIVK